MLRRHRQQKGFSLAELLIALGILGVGLAMAAALFPAGILAAKNAEKDVLGTVIAQNGLMHAKTFIRENNVPGTQDELGDCSSVLLSAEGYDPMAAIPWGYPSTDPKTDPPNDPSSWQDHQYGFVLLIRWANSSGLEVQVVSVSFQRTPGNDVELHDTTASFDTTDGVTTATFSDLTNVNVGTPVILAKNGTYGTIIEIDSNTRECILDKAPDFDTGTEDVWVVYEDGVPRSPAMSVQTGRWTLK